jgi:hypothetical protein
VKGNQSHEATLIKAPKNGVPAMLVATHLLILVEVMSNGQAKIGSQILVQRYNDPRKFGDLTTPRQTLVARTKYGDSVYVQRFNALQPPFSGDDSGAGAKRTDSNLATGGLLSQRIQHGS